jgi:dTDP-4-dehydrorhamnose reductase
LIVVFGASGQLGRELTAMAARERLALIGLTRLEADITDRHAVDRVIDRYRPALLVNAAAYNHVDRAEDEPETAMRVNADGPAIVATACARSGVPMVHISSDYVFDGTKAGPYREDDVVAPLGAYGLSKARGEEAVRDGCQEHLIIRTAWLFGVYGSNFVKTVLSLAQARDELNVVADQHGSPTSTEDLARAVVAVAAASGRGSAPWGTYHFAGSGATTWHGFASRIIAAQAPFTGRAPRVNAITSAQYPTAARRPANSVLDSTKFADAFGVRAANWEAAVDRTVARILSRGALA